MSSWVQLGVRLWLINNATSVAFNHMQLFRPLVSTVSGVRNRSKLLGVGIIKQKEALTSVENFLTPQYPKGQSTLSRDAARFSNPGEQAVMQWAQSAPLVGIGLTETPNSGPPTSGITAKYIQYSQ